ncbi:MAG: hypothetical protein N3F03_02645 [Ignavibacteria bacterium]|nr:hypothetical protein [Ignavibacteria bacterium]
MKNYFSLLLIFILTIFISETFAIPAFSRKYSLSCQTCHSPFPRLKDYGDSFARNGFVLADKESPRYFQETGDAELSLIRDVPIAFRLEGYATYKHKSNEDRFEIGSPKILKVLSGGSLAKDFSYYFYFYLDEEGEIAGVEDAYFMLNNFLGTGVDLYLGQFQVSDPLFKNELRLTLENYQVYKKKIGLSHINLSYDRGIMLNYELPTKTDLYFEVLNGTGLIPASDGEFDNDKFTNFVGRISQKLDEPFRVGGLIYLGKEKLGRNNLSFINKVNMYGGDLTLSLGDKFELNYQYIHRIDSQPDTGFSKIKTNSSMLELIFTPKGDESKWYAVGLINYINSEFPGSDYKSFALNLGYLLRRNIRLVGEFLFDAVSKTTKFSFGFVSAF